MLGFRGCFRRVLNPKRLVPELFYEAQMDGMDEPPPERLSFYFDRTGEGYAYSTTAPISIGLREAFHTSFELAQKVREICHNGWLLLPAKPPDDGCDFTGADEFRLSREVSPADCLVDGRSGLSVNPENRAVLFGRRVADRKGGGSR